MEINVCLFANFTSTKGGIALQVARKIAPCDRALIHACLAYLFLHSGQVLTILVTGPECIMNIHVILGKRNLLEMGAVRSARESRSVALVWRLGTLVTGAWFCAQGKQ